MKYRLTIYPAVELDTDEGKELLFGSIPELKAALSACASLLLYVQDDLGVMPDFSNMFLQEVFFNDEWIEIDEDDE